MLSCEYCKIFRNSIFVEHLWWPLLWLLSEELQDNGVRKFSMHMKMCGVSEKCMFPCSNTGSFVSHFMQHFQAHSTQFSCWIGFLLVHYFILMTSFRILDFEFRMIRSSHRRCSISKAVLKNFANFTEKHLCWSLFLIKLYAGRRLYNGFMV